MPPADTVIQNVEPGDKPQKFADDGSLYLLPNTNGSYLAIAADADA